MKRIAVLFAVLMLASCSAGFNREWQQALEPAKEAPGTISPVRGREPGAAKSAAINGELRCIVSVADQTGLEPLRPCSLPAGTPQTRRFHYHATFMKLLSATYDVTHQVTATTDGIFTSAATRSSTGLGGGLYHYEGMGTPARFSATYRSDVRPRRV